MAHTSAAPDDLQDDSTWSRTTADLRAAVEVRLRALVDTAARDLRRVDTDLVPVADELERWLASGGKRLRPVLVTLGHELAGGDADDVLGAAAAVELVHTWALLHDDLIDASATRRGAPTTHRRFAHHHRDLEWAGDPDDWGGAIAILLGDFVAVLADDAFATMSRDRVDVQAGQLAFSRLRREVMAGQVLDITVAASRDADVDRALRVATLKSGRYTVARPLEVGAVLGRAEPDLLEVIASAGDALGVAFQLHDDLLGMFGEPDVTGKPVGDDLREGKRTVLVAEAMARLSPVDAARLEAVLGVRDLDDDAVDDGLELVRASGARDATAGRIETLLATARDDLADLPEGRARTALFALADHIATRHH